MKKAIKRREQVRNVFTSLAEQQKKEKGQPGFNQLTGFELLALHPFCYYSAFLLSSLSLWSSVSVSTLCCLLFLFSHLATAGPFDLVAFCIDLLSDFLPTGFTQNPLGSKSWSEGLHHLSLRSLCIFLQLILNRLLTLLKAINTVQIQIYGIPNEAQLHVTSMQEMNTPWTEIVTLEFADTWMFLVKELFVCKIKEGHELHILPCWWSPLSHASVQNSAQNKV